MTSSKNKNNLKKFGC